jgi:hypothetical protein
MNGLLIFSGALLAGIVIGFIIFLIKHSSRKSEYKDWVVGDKIIVKSNSIEREYLQKAGLSMGILVGWNENNIYLKIGDSTVKSNWDCFNSNKSALWRRNYDECKKSMGVEPGFVPELGESKPISDKMIHGKPIEMLNEVECEVFLKKAIEEEDYDTAELIKKRMEKFR